MYVCNVMLFKTTYLKKKKIKYKSLIINIKSIHLIIKIVISVPVNNISLPCNFADLSETSTIGNPISFFNTALIVST